MIPGNNFVELVGYLKYPELKETRNGNMLFQGKVAIPFSYTDRQSGEQKEGTRYVKVSAWGDVAQELGNLTDGTPVRTQGIFNERSYDSNCKSCGVVEKKYWTDVLVNNFELVSEG